MESQLSVIVHGGAGRYQTSMGDYKLPVLKAARDAAWKELCANKAGHLAVAAALRILEGSEYFNAGFGGYPNDHGIVLLDVGIMKGNRNFISLINVRRMKYPSAVALDMMNEYQQLISIWTHERMQRVDAASSEIKERYGWVETHEDLVAPYVTKLIEKKDNLEVAAEDGHGTVGCVVRDCHGDLCAGTSTGGVSFKSNGRVGDTPIIGSGVFADNEIGALSTTGHGEAILQNALSGFVIAELRAQLRKNRNIFKNDSQLLGKILDSEISEVVRKVPEKSAAIIVIPPNGAPAYALTKCNLSVAMISGQKDAVSDEYTRLYAVDGSFMDL